MKLFGNLTKGDDVYVAVVEDTEFRGGIKTRKVKNVTTYYETGTVSIDFEDGLTILARLYDSCQVRTPNANRDKASEPFFATIYSPEYESCIREFKRLSGERLKKATEEYKLIGEQLARICLVSSEASSLVRDFEKKKENKEVVLETVFAD